MISLDLHRSIQDRCWPGIHIYTRFASLQRYRDLLEEYVPLMHDQALLRWRAEVARNPPPSNVAEQEELFADLEVRLKHDISNNFYSAYLIPLYAALESSLADLCDYVQRRESISLKVTDLREHGVVNRALMYLNLVLKKNLPTTELVQSALHDLQVVRNAFAHSNGRLAEQRSINKQELERLAKDQQWVEIWDGHIIVRPAFLERSTESVEDFLNNLLDVI